MGYDCVFQSQVIQIWWSLNGLHFGRSIESAEDLSLLDPNVEFLSESREVFVVESGEISRNVDVFKR